jgi:predicted Zn-dependent peptidase
MHAYFRRRYVPNNMMLVVSGRVDPDEVFDAARRHCGQWAAGEPAAPRIAPQIRSGVAVRKVDRFNQQMLALNFGAPSATDPLHETAQAVAAILGGGNSRFHWNIEQAGLSPHAGAYRLDYADCGMLILMAQCDPENAERLLDAMRCEASRLMHQSIADSEIQRVKNKRRTSLAVEGEAPHHRLLQVMDDVDYRSRPRTVEERLAAVEAVSHDSLRAYFERFPIDTEGLLVSVGPRAFPAAA